MEPFSIDSDLRARPSPLTAAGIDKYLTTMASGLNGIGKAVMAAAAKYGINATYILAHAIHETGWGTSAILKKKNNLFGWEAFDDSPFASAKGFPDQATCVDFVMGKVKERYLSPGGVHFREKPCLGNKTYGMNVKYASDAQWGEKIARIARKLEKDMG
ncbi:MAG TPA: glucosaminidase domain-containing protein [Longimicrobium sp.]